VVRAKEHPAGSAPAPAVPTFEYAYAPPDSPSLQQTYIRVRDADLLRRLPEVQAPVSKPGIVAGLVGFFETLVGLVMVALIVVGIVALTLTWRTSDVEFMSGGKLRITQFTW
jgi:hypothetical protein